MKPITHGMPHRYIRRNRVVREKLDAGGWKCHDDTRFANGLWTHPKVPGHTMTRRAAATLQAAWEAAKAGGA